MFCKCFRMRRVFVADIHRCRFFVYRLVHLLLRHFISLRHQRIRTWFFVSAYLRSTYMRFANEQSPGCYCSGSFSTSVNTDALRSRKLEPLVYQTFGPSFQGVRAKSRNKICPELLASTIFRAEHVLHVVAECSSDLAVCFLGVNDDIRCDRICFFVCVRVIFGADKGQLFSLFELPL